jgi:hypothetical protein
MEQPEIAINGETNYGGGRMRVKKDYRIWAEAEAGKWSGWFHLPGKIPEKIKGSWRSEIEATAAAGLAMCTALNGRYVATSKFGYKRLSGGDLAGRLAELQLSPTEFSRIWGTDQRRVMSWIDGDQDIPYAVGPFLEMLSLPGGLQVARRMADEAIDPEYRRPA